MDRSDAELITAHHAGDRTAFAELVRRHADSLLRYHRRMNGRPELAEDCFQETFRRAYEKAGLFNGRGSFKSWLFAIATNVALDGIRKKTRRPKMISLNVMAIAGEGETASFEPADPRGHDPAGNLLREEQKSQVRRALAQLPEQQRAALVLVYYQGLSYSETAAALGCSLASAKTHVYRALRKLAGKLPQLGERE